MPVAKFLSPLGEEIDIADVSKLKQLVLTRGEEYWSIGSGEAGIDFVKNGQVSKLRLIFYKGLGFHIVYLDPEGNRFISLGPGTFDQLVAPRVGGDPLYLPAKFFLSPQTTWQVIKSFCNSGRQSPRVSWANSEELDWRPPSS